MSGLRVLITNMTLAGRTGTETAVKDLALGLLKAGHSPVVYSPDLGDIARELRAASVPVVDDLSNLAVVPDVIHGNHHAETVTALLHFAGVPAIHVCHAFLSSVAIPPRFPRVRRYVAVDDTCRDRLVCEHGIPESHVRVLRNAVDLERFHPREPLPARPFRALVFSNYATSESHLPAVQAACDRHGLSLDVLGAGVGTGRTDPETVLGNYDVVFAKGRCALEALACGVSVVLCDANGCGPLVTASNLIDMRRLNFGLRARLEPVTSDALSAALRSYDPADAAEVSRRVRATAGLELGIQEYIDLYAEVIAEHRNAPPVEPVVEARAAAAYLRQVTAWAQDIRAYEELARARQQECDRLRAELEKRPAAPPARLKSCLCTQAQLESPAFRQWAARMGQSFKLHRKLWEFAYICQALSERDMLRPGRRGLGFAVGREPLAALFAQLGCDVVATDLDEDRARVNGWVDSHQHAARLEDLNATGLCDPDLFRRRVAFRSVDMNDIPSDLCGFDFVWSSCSFEHLGSIAHGRRFIQRMARCLKPDGVAVHTTEFNLSSDTDTIDNNPGFVIFRKCDIDGMVADLAARGRAVELDLNPGDGPADRHVDQPPYPQETHLKLQLGGFVATSMGLIAEPQVSVRGSLRGEGGLLAATRRLPQRLARAVYRRLSASTRGPAA